LLQKFIKMSLSRFFKSSFVFSVLRVVDFILSRFYRSSITEDMIRRLSLFFVWIGSFLVWAYQGSFTLGLIQKVRIVIRKSQIVSWLDRKVIETDAFSSSVAYGKLSVILRKLGRAVELSSARKWLRLLIAPFRFSEFWLALFSLAYFFKGGDVGGSLLNLTFITWLASIVCVGFDVVKAKKFSFKFNSFDFSVVVFMLIIFASLIYAPSASFGMHKLTRFISLVFVPYFLVRLSLFKKEKIRRFLVFFIGGCLIISLIPFINPFDEIKFVWYRLTFLEINPVPLGVIMGISIIFLLLSIYCRKSKHKWFLVFPLIPVSLVFLLAQTRAAIISLVLSLSFLGLSIFLFKENKVNKMIPHLVVILLALVIFLPQVFQHYQLESRFQPGTAGGSVTLQERKQMYSDGFNIFRNNVIFGTGFAGYRYFTGSDYPHNIFIEVLSELGLAGLFVFLMILILFFKNNFRLLSTNKLCDPLLLILFIIPVYLLIESQFSFSLDNQKWLFMFFGLNLNALQIYFR